EIDAVVTEPQEAVSNRETDSRSHRRRGERKASDHLESAPSASPLCRAARTRAENSVRQATPYSQLQLLNALRCGLQLLLYCRALLAQFREFGRSLDGAIPIRPRVTHERCEKFIANIGLD